MVARLFYLLFFLILIWIGISALGAHLVTRIESPKSNIAAGETQVWFRIEDGQYLNAVRQNSGKDTLVILLHGIRSNLDAMRTRARVYQELGYSTLLLDLRGHGSNEEQRTGFGFTESQDLAYVLKSVRKDYPFVAIHGCSLGAATALYSLRNSPDYAWMVIESPYDNIDHAFEHRIYDIKFPNFVLRPLKYWVNYYTKTETDSLNTLNYAALARTPVLHFAGTREKQIPLEESEAIYQAIGSTCKRSYWFEGALHQDLLKFDSLNFRKQLTSFLYELPACIKR